MTATLPSRGARRRLAGALGAGTAGLLAVLIHLLLHGGESTSGPPAPSLIPAYVRPPALLALAASDLPPAVVVLNPASGPGTEAEAAYHSAVVALQRAGHTVLGYVHTGYGARSQDAVVDDVRRYVRWYGVDGIFLDEVASGAEALPHYRALTRAVRAGGGGAFIALNPGVVPDRGYFDIADTVVTFEGTAAAFAAHQDPKWVRAFAPDGVTHLVYDDPSAPLPAPDAGARLYRTPGALPNPWGTLPAGL